MTQNRTRKQNQGSRVRNQWRPDQTVYQTFCVFSPHTLYLPITNLLWSECSIEGDSYCNLQARNHWAHMISLQIQHRALIRRSNHTEQLEKISKHNWRQDYPLDLFLCRFERTFGEVCETNNDKEIPFSKCMWFICKDITRTYVNRVKRIWNLRALECDFQENMEPSALEKITRKYVNLHARNHLCGKMIFKRTWRNLKH
jgi:hypothetical protein